MADYLRKNGVTHQIGTKLPSAYPSSKVTYGNNSNVEAELDQINSNLSEKVSSTNLFTNVTYDAVTDSDGRIFVNTPTGYYPLFSTSPTASPRLVCLNWDNQTMVYAPQNISARITGKVYFIKQY